MLQRCAYALMAVLLTCAQSLAKGGGMHSEDRTIRSTLTTCLPTFAARSIGGAAHQKLYTPSPAILTTPEGSSSILNTSCATATAPIAPSLAACIRCMVPQAGAIGFCEATMLRPETESSRQSYRDSSFTRCSGPGSDALAAKGTRCLFVAHRDRPPFSGRPSLTGHCGHGWTCSSPRPVAIDPFETSKGATRSPQ